MSLKAKSSRLEKPYHSQAQYRLNSCLCQRARFVKCSHSYLTLQIRPLTPYLAHQEVAHPGVAKGLLCRA